MFDSSFEIKFSQLADARLQEMVPSLSEYKVGFQLIDKNEESTKGAGAMAFLINNTWIYIPAFFLAGKLKLPCLYIKNYDIRTPLNDSWVSYIKSNELESFGDLVPSDAVKVDGAKADLLNIIGKTGSEKNDFLNKEEIVAMFSSTQCADTSLIHGLRKLGKESFIKMAAEMNGNDEFANAVFRYYEPQELRKLAIELDEIPVEEVIPPVRVLTKESAEAAKLKDDEKLKMMREGCFIKDDRIDTSLVYKRNNAIETGFATPSKSGFYDVLMSDGNTKECIIVYPHNFKEETYPSNHGKRKTRARCAVILKSKPTDYVMATATNIMARNCKDIDSSNIKGTSTSIKDNLNRSKLAEMNACSILLVDSSGNSYILDSINEWPNIKFTDKPGKLHVRYGTLMIPNGIMTFKQKDNFEDTSDTHMALGDVNTFVNECTRKAELTPLKIYHDSGNGYFVNSNKVDKQALNKQSALELLVFDHGVRAEEAAVMIKEAADHGASPKTSRYLIKYAGIMDMSTDMGTIGSEVSNNSETTSVMSPGEMTDLAVKASDSGLKEVMDTSIIASLLGTSKSLTKIGDFIPDLIKAMDRLGSILMLYYWDNEGFEEQYGRQELAELEDKLVSVFNEIGDVTLFLKEKTTDADSIFDGNRGNISEDMGDDA